MVAASWFTPREAAAYTRCDVATLRRAVKAGRLRAYRVNGGHRVRFHQTDLDAWLKGGAS